MGEANTPNLFRKLCVRPNKNDRNHSSICIRCHFGLSVICSGSVALFRCCPCDCCSCCGGMPRTLDFESAILGGSGAAPRTLEFESAIFGISGSSGASLADGRADDSLDALLHTPCIHRRSPSRGTRSPVSQSAVRGGNPRS